MTEELWTKVDGYLAGSLSGSDPVLEQVLATTSEAGLPAIQVSANQGKLLHLLARSVSAQRILEIGTLGGYSAIWLARALPPDGRLVTLEVDPKHAEVARRNIAAAGLDGVVELRLAPALDSLAQLVAEGEEPFDLVFIDADKEPYADYFTAALRLTRAGSLVVVDNVVRGGRVVDESSDDPSVRGVRKLYELVGNEERVSATALQTVGSKGYDGLMLALVTAEAPAAGSGPPARR